MMLKTKKKRLDLIRAILKSGTVHTQSELKKRLREKNMNVSQATISRDLKELGYIRAPISDGSYRIVKVEGGKERLDLLLKMGLVELKQVGNIIIIKTKPGNANALGNAIDRAGIEEIVGTVAGDDTIFAVSRDETLARQVIKKLKRLVE
ncbi:MAG TPA: arginine repressor [bacterium (Candidatus Stahlbacteria)]|nr:arginine repressor [Candidatus Stahlbacteria bacterium]